MWDLLSRLPFGSVIRGLVFLTIRCETKFSFTHNWILHKLFAIILLNLLAMNICRPNWGHLIATLKLPNSFHIRSAEGGGPKGKVMNPSTNSANRHWASSRFLSVLGTWKGRNEISVLLGFTVGKGDRPRKRSLKSRVINATVEAGVRGATREAQ